MASGGPPVVGVALARDLLAVDDEPRARGAGRLHRVLHDHGQERVRVVGGRECVAEAGDRVAHPPAFGVELPQALLELRRHVVEGLAEGGELVAPAHRDPLLEAPLGDAGRRPRRARRASGRSCGRTCRRGCRPRSSRRRRRAGTCCGGPGPPVRSTAFGLSATIEIDRAVEARLARRAVGAERPVAEPATLMYRGR